MRNEGMRVFLDPKIPAQKYELRNCSDCTLAVNPKSIITVILQ